MTWTVYSTCSLCSARTQVRSGDGVEELRALVDADRREDGWLDLHDVRAERQRVGVVVCADCLADISTAVAGKEGGPDGADGTGQDERGRDSRMGAQAVDVEPGLAEEDSPAGTTGGAALDAEDGGADHDPAGAPAVGQPVANGGAGSVPPLQPEEREPRAGVPDPQCAPVLTEATTPKAERKPCTPKPLPASWAPSGKTKILLAGCGINADADLVASYRSAVATETSAKWTDQRFILWAKERKRQQDQQSLEAQQAGQRHLPLGAAMAAGP